MEPVAPLNELSDLRRRVASLTRSNRLLALSIAVVFVAGAGVAASTTQPASQIVRASAIQLVDADGHVRAELAIDKDGSAGLFVYDNEHNPRATVTHDDDQSALFLWDKDGQIRVGIAQFAHGGGGIAMHGPHGKGSTALYHKGAGSLTFYGDDGKITKRVSPNDD